MRIKLNCLACGHLMELGDAYEDYQGEIRCWGCQAVVEVTLHEGKLQSMKLSNGEAEPPHVDAGAPEALPQPPQPRAASTAHPTHP